MQAKHASCSCTWLEILDKVQNISTSNNQIEPRVFHLPEGVQYNFHAAIDGSSLTPIQDLKIRIWISPDLTQTNLRITSIVILLV